MGLNLIHIGFGNLVSMNRIVAIISSGPAPMKRMKEVARKENRLIDATHGRKTRSIIITDSNHIVLSSVQPETISQRMNELKC